MRRLPLALAVLTAALALAPAAHAKGTLGTVSVCGPSGCTQIADRAARHAFSVALFDGVRAAPVAPLGPYYEIRTSPALGLELYYVPGGPALVAGEDWRALGGVRDALRAAASGLPPFRPRLTSVFVGTHTVADTAPYARLLDRLPVVQNPPYKLWTRKAVYVSMGFSRVTPWSGRDTVRFEPRSGLVFGADGRWLRPPAALAARIRSDSGTAAKASSKARNGQIAMASAAAVAVAATAFVVAWRRRRNGHGAA